MKIKLLTSWYSGNPPKEEQTEEEERSLMWMPC